MNGRDVSYEDCRGAGEFEEEDWAFGPANAADIVMSLGLRWV